MRSIKIILMLVALSVAAPAQQPARTPAKSTHLVPAPLNPAGREKLHESAMKFAEASDVRQRVAKSLDALLEEGKQSMLHNNPLMDPQFGDEWVQRMRQRVSLDEFVNATANAYERYFTSDELDELTQGQLALKKGELHSLSPELAQKLKSNSPRIQKDINTETSMIGSRVGKEVGEGIAKDHPEWVKPATTASAPSAEKKQ